MLIKDVQAYFTLSIPITAYLPIGIPTIYAITGYTIYEKKDKIKSDIRIPIAFGFLAIVTETIRYILQVQLCKTDLTEIHYCYWNTGMSYIVTLSVIIVIISIPFKYEILGKSLTYIGSLTFSIYLVHYSVNQFLLSRGFEFFVCKLIQCTPEKIPVCSITQEMIYIFLKCLCVFLISFCISVIIKLCKKYINIIILNLFHKNLSINHKN